MSLTRYLGVTRMDQKFAYNISQKKPCNIRHIIIMCVCVRGWVLACVGRGRCVCVCDCRVDYNTAIYASFTVFHINQLQADDRRYELIWVLPHIQFHSGGTAVLPSAHRGHWVCFRHLLPVSMFIAAKCLGLILVPYYFVLLRKPQSQ